MPLTSEQLRRVQFLVQPAAWAFHETLPDEQAADLEVALAETGDLRLVAAYVLDVVAQAAGRAGAAASAGQVKRFRVEGEYEEEYFAGTSVEAGDAQAWATRAAQLRADVKGELDLRDQPGTVSGPVEVSF